MAAGPEKLLKDWKEALREIDHALAYAPGAGLLPLETYEDIYRAIQQALKAVESGFKAIRGKEKEG